MNTLKSMRLHIGIFGKTNVGKSSLVNTLTGQETSIISNIPGTTTDVVEKSMELLPIGAVNILDTAGIDDSTQLANERIEKTMKVLNRTDIAILVCDYTGFNNFEFELINNFEKLKIPFIVLINKNDIQNISDENLAVIQKLSNNIVISSTQKDNELILKIKEELIKLLPNEFVNSPKIVGDIVSKKSTVILVTPIDKEAPKGRLILPQVQTIRDLLDSSCITLVVKETELEDAIASLKEPPALVITDSQAFKIVDNIVPKDIPLTSFSILFARLKGDLNEFSKGAESIQNLKDGDSVLILESCTHHPIEDDIGKVKIPRLLKKKTGKDLNIDHYAGHDFPNIDKYKLIIHCGACMTNRREVLSRILLANEKNIPITNYGIAISYCLGILPRAIRVFK